jgi:co-chaperonin GroES (HSP10)
MKRTKEIGKLSVTNTLDIDRKIKPLSRRILVRKCVNDHIRDEDGTVLVYKPDWVYEQTNTAEIVAVADDCRIFTCEHIGGFVELPEHITGLDCVDEEKELFTVEEKILDDVTESGVVFFTEDE